MRIMLVSLWHVEYAMELAMAIAKHNDVHLILLRKRVKETVGENTLTSLEPVLSCSLLNFRSLKHHSTVIAIMKTVATVFRFKPDVIHIQECYNPLNIIFLFLRKFPIVATVHDVVVHTGEDSQTVPRWKLFLVNINRKFAYKKIIVHGYALKQLYLQTYKNTEQDIFVIPHGCLFTFHESEQNNAVQEPYTVLFFGRINRYKGLKYLIKAEPIVREKIPGIRIIVAGKGEDLEKYKLQILSNPHYEIHDHFIPNRDVAELFQRAAIIVLPYVEASQSGVVAMAFAFGKPVIVANVGSLAEMVKDNYTGIVIPPRDSLALADAMISLLSDSSKRRRMASHTHVVSKTKLAWDSVARLTVETYVEAEASKKKVLRN